MSRFGKNLRTALLPYKRHVAQFKRNGFVVLMVVALLFMLRFAYDPDRTHRLRQQQYELEHLLALNVELVEEIERSRAELDALRTDSNFLVHVARRDLGMLMPGEFVYEFQEPAQGR